MARKVEGFEDIIATGEVDINEVLEKVVGHAIGATPTPKLGLIYDKNFGWRVQSFGGLTIAEFMGALCRLPFELVHSFYEKLDEDIEKDGVKDALINLGVNIGFAMETFDSELSIAESEEVKALFEGMSKLAKQFKDNTPSELLMKEVC